MSEVSLADIPEELLRLLERRAAEKHTSLNDELVACLALSLGLSSPSGNEILREARKMRSGISGSLNDADLQAMKAEGRP